MMIRHRGLGCLLLLALVAIAFDATDAESRGSILSSSGRPSSTRSRKGGRDRSSGGSGSGSGTSRRSGWQDEGADDDEGDQFESDQDEFESNTEPPLPPEKFYEQSAYNLLEEEIELARSGGENTKQTSSSSSSSSSTVGNKKSRNRGSKGQVPAADKTRNMDDLDFDTEGTLPRPPPTPKFFDNDSWPTEDDEETDAENDSDDRFQKQSGGDDDDDDDASDVESEETDVFRGGRGKEALYEAYNQLHSLAQAYDKSFDAPAVVVVGHQSSGKSALIEALMGFQFNQVGGGTKTRRPVALRLQYNPKCRTPRWFLQEEDGVERPKSMSEIQDYIDRENRRLERDPLRSFDSREINVRMEYKHCPNMILIDTPGLIAAPRIPRKQRSGANQDALAQQRALQASAREAERLVVEKIRCEDYIILCVEDTSDWKHGQTREVVQKADPDLSRTVIVNTKFDTKIPQFGTPSDVEDFIRAPILEKILPHKLGGPFFTTVPSGRVARAYGAGPKGASFDVPAPSKSGDFLFDSDEEFVNACSEAEVADRNTVLKRLKRIGKANEAASSGVMTRIGLKKLRTFLEERVDESYRRNVQKIIPMLQADHKAAERRLEACERELEALSVERLKAGADAFCDEFCQNLKKALQGSIIAPASLFGETLEQEIVAAGSFHDVQGSPMGASDRTWERLVVTEVGGKDHRLYGGAQYHRCLREFHLASKCLRTPSISEDEIANAAGIGEIHDGVNFLHAACVISLEKARSSFEPLLIRLQARMVHVMERLAPVTEYMIRQGREREKITSLSQYSSEKEKGKGAVDSFQQTMDISQNPQFRQLIRAIFVKFVYRCADNAMMKCRDDLIAITRYVTWNLGERSSGALNRALPDRTDMVAVYRVALEASGKKDAIESGKESGNQASSGSGVLTRREALSPITEKGKQDVDRDYQNLLQLMEEAVMSRDDNRSKLIVSGLVHYIVSHWREQFCKSVITKFNCFFMVPFVDEFHQFIRGELRKLCEGEADGLADVFDLTAARRALQQHRDELANECLANKRLQEQFKHCARMMKTKPEDEKTQRQPSALDALDPLESI